MINFKIGIIGIGNHFKENLMPNLMATQGLIIQSVYSSDPQKASYFKNVLKAKKTFLDWKKLIKEGDIDGVIITGSPDFHEKIIHYAINQKIFVFVEKPPVASYKSLKKILKEKHNFKNRIFVNYSFRHSQSFDEMRKIISQYSDIAYLNIRYITNKPRACMWNYTSIFESFLMAVGIHPIEMTIDIFKKKPIKIDLQFSRITPVFFSATIFLKFEHNKNAIIQIGNYSNKLEMRYEMINKDGEIGVLSGFEHFKFYNLKKNRIVIDHPFYDLTGEKYEICYTVPSTKDDYYKNGYGRAIELFYKTMSGKIPNPSPLENSLLVYYVINKLVRKYQRLKQKPIQNP